MNKEFVTYEQALALKELGFDEPCIAAYFNQTKEITLSWYPKCIVVTREENYVCKNSSRLWCKCTAPLYQQAFRWFREKHNLYSEINLDSYKEPYSLKVTIKHLDDTNTFVDKEYLPYSNGIGDIDNKTYEEAEQACLDKLIEIVKNK